MPTSVPALVLTQNCEVKSVKFQIQKEQEGCSLSDVQKFLKKKTAPVLLGTYSWKGQTLHLLGYKEGKAGTENQHELPPPLDKDLYFGEIVILLSKDKKSFAKPILMKSDEYENFYTQMFEGFESLDEDSEQEEEYEEEQDEEDVKHEAEFEENEEFSDDNDDQETLEEFDGHPKVEEEEDDPVPILRKKATKSKGKGKAQKDTNQGLLFGGTELTAEESISTTLPTEAHRANTCSVIHKYMNSYFTMSQSLELEHYIYNMSLQAASKKHIPKSWSIPLFVEVYTSLARKVLGNLNPTSYIQNKNLLVRYQEGQMTLEELAGFSFSDLYPEIWKELSMRQFEREKRQLEGNKSMATDQFECKRCHKRECTYYELQTRSADEPMTIFIQCVNCGKHWRQ